MGLEPSGLQACKNAIAYHGRVVGLWGLPRRTPDSHSEPGTLQTLEQTQMLASRLFSQKCISIYFSSLRGYFFQFPLNLITVG